MFCWAAEGNEIGEVADGAEGAGGLRRGDAVGGGEATEVAPQGSGQGSFGLWEGEGRVENRMWNGRGAQGKMPMKRLVWLVLFEVVALSSVPLAFATGDTDEAGNGLGEAVVLGEEDFAERLEMLRNQYRRMTPGNGELVQDAGTWPVAWEEFSPRWDTAPATRDLATWVVPIVAEREGGATVLRDGNGAELWRGTTDFAKEKSSDVTLTGALVDESDWPLYTAVQEELAWRRVAEIRRQESGGLRGYTNGPCTTGLHFVSAQGNFAISPPELHFGLIWTNNGTVDVFAYGPLHVEVTNEVTWTNDENVLETTNVVSWHSVEPTLTGFDNAWEWVGAMAVSNTGTNVFIDSPFPANRGIVRYYAAVEAVDSDGDGLNDGFETFVSHSDPELGDSDGDGIGDGLEAAMGADPADPGNRPLVLLNAVFYNTGDSLPGREWVELYSAESQSVDLSEFRLEVARTNDWYTVAEFEPGTVIAPGQCLLAGGSLVTNADTEAVLGIPDTGSTGVRLVWNGAPNGAVLDTVMIGGNTNFVFDASGWLSSTSVWARTGKAVERRYPGWDTDRIEDWRWVTNRTGQASGINIDTDGDGLSDAVERAGSANTNALWFGEPTDPWNADSDGDGLGDHDECVVHGTNPNAWSSDGDIWPWAVPGTAVSNWPGSDSFELANGWNPLVADENTNGIPDSWEMAMVPTNNPTAPGAAFWSQGVDSDGDGVDNLSELEQNSNPTDAADSTLHDFTYHFESSCPGWTNGRIDNDVGFRGWVKLVFDSVVPGRCIGVKVSDGNVMEEFDLTWCGADELARFAESTVQTQYISGIVGTTPCLKVQDAGLHPHEGRTQGGEYNIVAFGGRILPDWNRDRQINATDAKIQDSGRTFRFWVNDDDDESDGSGDDVPGHMKWWFIGYADYGNSEVDGPGDLEDLFPVWLDIQPILTNYPAGMTCKLSQTDGALNAVYTAYTATDAGSYLQTNRFPTCGGSFQQLPEESDLFRITATGVELSTTFTGAIRQNGQQGVLLLEGREDTSAPLMLEIWRGDQLVFAETLPLKLSGVEDMYRWVNLRGECGGDVGRESSSGVPKNAPDAESNGKQIVFVHGYSVHEESARAWSSEMFKRLWQSGSKSMFTAVTWYGNDGQIYDWVPFFGGATPNYYINVEHAFETAAVLGAALASIPGEKQLMAHSLGNVVASSAIAEHQFAASRYFLFNAAVPLEAYCPAEATNTLLRHPDWDGYARRLWASDWHALFPAGDGRRELTWKGRFGSISNAVNFYSPADEVLMNATGSLPSLGREAAWVTQEMRKGTTLIWLGPGNYEAGWGFNAFYDVVDGMDPNTGMPIFRRRTPGETLGLTTGDLQAHSFFENFDEQGLYGPNGGTLAGQAALRNQLLADAIPALSNPMGSNPLPNAGPTFSNVDMLELRPAGTSGVRGSGGTDLSEHSAIMQLPYSDVSGVFGEMLERGNLR